MQYLVSFLLKMIEVKYKVMIELNMIYTLTLLSKNSMKILRIIQKKTLNVGSYVVDDQISYLRRKYRRNILFKVMGLASDTVYLY